ncbi:phage portal protein [Clostridium botulinum]|nr:phage portal protein [Clostridium botulinum]
MINNVMDLLLKADTSKLKRATKEVKIQSLSESFGQDVVFTLQAIPIEKYNEIQEQGVSIDEEELSNIDYNKIQMLTVLEGVKEPNLKSKELMEHFKAHTPIELLQRMFSGRPGEIATLYNNINDLCGFGRKAIEEIKN